MSQSTRTFGAMISGITIGGVSFVAVCKQVTPDFELNTQMATALRDGWEYPVGIRGKWSISGQFFISTANATGEGGPGGTLWTAALARSQVAVSLTDNAIAGAGNTLAGYGIITKVTQPIADDAQTIDITIMGQGTLSSAIA